MSISTAVGQEYLSRTSGYKIKKGNFDTTSTNLPQIVAVFGEVNTANQNADFTRKEITSSKEAAELYGYGSPLHQIFRILRPVQGLGIGGIVTIAFPQISDAAATATAHEWTITGTATENATHKIYVAGRSSIDFVKYDVAIVKGDTDTVIASKISDAVNGVLSSPVTAAVSGNIVTFTSKWKGKTSAEVKLRFDTVSKPAGISYAQTNQVLGAGTVDMASSLAQFGNDWITTVINPYGVDAFDDLEAFNGFPDPETPTGRYEGQIFKPFMSFFGSTLSDKDDLSAITDNASRVNQVTNVLCPAPLSEGFSWEAAANVVRLFCRIMQDTPHLDVNNKSYPDMPSPANAMIGDMADYINRDFLLKKGCSTVLLENGAYVIQDLVTTYHPDGELPLQYNYCRNLNLDWNVSSAYRVLEDKFVKDHVLIRDNQFTDVPRAVKPIEWKAVVLDLFSEMATKALIKDPEFSEASLRVEISAINPNRFDTFFRYKRTGIARIESTDVEAGF